MNAPKTDPGKKLVSRLNACGAFLVLSGLFHIPVWLFWGGDWEGSVSWRKPILFGISTGATLLSIAWIYPRLRPRDLDTGLYSLLGLSLVAEVALITLQQWRGVESHFNHATQFDATVERWMTYLIVFATVVLVDLTVRSFGHVGALNDQKMAIRAGLTFLVTSCLIGFAILLHGETQLRLGENPSIYGQAGVTKFPHGVAIHAIQLLPIACWYFTKLGIPLEKRIQLVRFLIAATSAFLAFSLIQTYAGRARFDLTITSALPLTASLIFLAPVVKTILQTKWSRLLTVRAGSVASD